MELFIAIELQIVLLFVLTISSISDVIPILFQQINKNNLKIWILGISDINTAKGIIYLAKEYNK